MIVLVLKPKEKELKSIPVNIRVKPSVKKNFDKLCKYLNYSQADLFEALVALGEDHVSVSDEPEDNST